MLHFSLKYLISSFIFQIFSKLGMDSSLKLFSKICELNSSVFSYSERLCRSLPHSSSNTSFQFLIYFCIGNCLFFWAFPSCMISWKAWCHGMMQWFFLFSLLFLLFFDVLSSFTVVIPNNMWLLTVAEL